MTRRLICSAGIATILAFAWGQPAHAQDYAPNGWIRTDAWKLLYISTSCGAGGETCAGCGNPQGFFAPGHADVNWVAPHNIGTEDPMVGESWEDITPAAAGTNGPGEFRGGTTWETTATLGAADILGDVVDHDAILARLGLNTDNVYGIAITYVENVSGAPLLVQICSASDDSIQVWVNDVLAQSNSACRGTAGDCAETALVQIPTGVSKIVTITHEGGGGFGFRFALRRAGVRLADGNGLIEFLGPSDDVEGQTGVTQIVDPADFAAANGWIEAGNWNLLFPLGNPGGAPGGGAANMARNWVAPHDIGEEDPKFGDVWSDIAFNGAAASSGWFWANILPNPIWVTTEGLNESFPSLRALNHNAEVIDFQGLVDIINADVVPGNPGAVGTLAGDNVLGIATTYVENKTGAPLPIGICTGSDDSIQVWVNDQIVTNVSSPRGTSPDCSETFPAILLPGVNKIATLTFEGGGGWGFRLALIKEDGTKYNDAFDGTDEIEILGSGREQPGVVGQFGFAVSRTVENFNVNCPSDEITVNIIGNGAEGAGPYTVEDRLTMPLDPVTLADNLDAFTVDATGGGELVHIMSDEDTFTNVSSTGRDLWQDCDHFQFDYAEVSGDFDFAVEVTNYAHETGFGRWGKFGPMARFGLENTALFHMAQSHGPTIEDAARAAVRATHSAAGTDLCDNTAEVGSGFPGGSEMTARPRFSRVRRIGQTTTVCLSNNPAVLDNPTVDANWQFCHTQDWGGALPDTLLVGYANSEHDDGGGNPYGGNNWQAITYRVLEGPAPTNFVLVGGEDVPLSTTGQGSLPVRSVVRWADVSASVLNEGVSYTVSYDSLRPQILHWLSPSGTISSDDVAGVIPPPTPLTIRNTTGPIGPFENSHDMGIVNFEGSTEELGPDAIVLAGSGADIWDNGVDARFAYSEITGDFDAIVRIANIDLSVVEGSTGEWGRAGIMAAYSCDRGTRYSAAIQPIRAADPGNPLGNRSPRHQTRPTHNAGGIIADQVFTVQAYETATSTRTGWLRLVRCGRQFASFWANDEGGEPGEWFFLGADTQPNAPETLLLGVVAGSHGSLGNQTPIPVTFDNWSVVSRTWPELTIVTDEEGRLTVDLDDPEALANAVLCNGHAVNFGPGIVDFGGTNVLRLVDNATGSDGNNVLFPLPGFNLGDNGFQASFTAYYSKPGTAGDVNPADGGGFVVYEGVIADACSVQGDPGGSLGYGNAARDNLPTIRRTSMAVVIDTWSTGNGAGATTFAAPGADQGADTVYTLALHFNQSMTQAQTNQIVGVPVPPIFSQSADFPAVGLSLEVYYAPIDDTVSRVQVYGWPSTDPGMRTLILDSLGPRLRGDITAGFAAGTGGATLNFDVTDISIAPICSEQSDSVVIEGPTEGVVGGDPVELTAVASGLDGPATYEWSAEGPGELTSNAATASLACTGAGVVTVNVSVADGGCADDASASLEITCSGSAGGAQRPGDANGDGNLDLSDPIALLQNLFVETRPLACGDDPNVGGNLILLDWNDDGAVDISDPVATLSFLFSGGTPHHLDDTGVGQGCVRIEGCPDGPCTP